MGFVPSTDSRLFDRNTSFKVERRYAVRGEAVRRV